MIALPQTFQIERVRRNLGTAEKPIWYLDVQWREKWFREENPGGTIDTKLLHLDTETIFEREEDLKVWDQNAQGYNGRRGAWVKVWDNETHTYKKKTVSAPGFAIVQATVNDGVGEVKRMKMVRYVDFYNYVEKAEAGAVGRALATLGYTIEKG